MLDVDGTKDGMSNGFKAQPRGSIIFLTKDEIEI
jgi:hypothetical protein